MFSVFYQHAGRYDALRTHIVAMCALSIGLMLCGCATTIVPPTLEPGEQRTTIVLADYGRHTGLVLPRNDRSDRFVEYAYGEWQWFAEGRKGPLDAVRALLWPTRGTLGRRELTWPFELSVGEAAPEEYYTLIVRRADVDLLLEKLDARYAAETEITTYNELSELNLVRDPSRYWVFNNCNTVLADWLRMLDCDIRGFAILSDWRIAGGQSSVEAD